MELKNLEKHPKFFCGVGVLATGIKVAAIAPGTVDTSLYDHWNQEDKSYINSGGTLQA